MTLLGDEFVIDGYKLDPVVTQRVTAARLIGRDKGAMSLELTIWDGDGRVMREGKLTRSSAPKKGPFKQASWARYGESRLIFDGILFRLAAADKVGPTLRLTWDDEAAALERRHTRAIVVSRGSKTRAQVLGMGADAVKEIAIPFRCPEEKIKQNVEAPDDESESKGLTKSDHITVKTKAADREQLKNMETALTVADQLLAGESATLAALVAGIAESRFINETGGSGTSQGVLQVEERTAANTTPRSIVPGVGDIPGVKPATLVPGIGVVADATGRIAPGHLDPRDVKEVFRIFFLTGYTDGVGAIKYAADHPDAEIYEIAQHIQGSGAGRPSNGESNYGPWVSEAQKILAAWGGVGQTTVLRERKQFQLGGKLNPDDKKPENYWAGSNRLAEEVDGWNLWAWRNQVNFVSDEWLFKRKPVFVVGPANLYAAERGPADDLVPFVDLDYHADVGSTTQEVTIKTVSRRWDGAPGSTVLIDDLGPVSGKWLISENDFDLQRDIAELTLRRPVEKAPEPATSTRKITTSAGPDASGDIAYPLAEKGTLLGTPGAGTHFWGQNWQSSNAIDIGVPVGTTVYATEDGVISPPGTEFSGFGDGGAGRFAGKRLHLKADGSTRAWFYTHLSEYEPGIKPGTHVSKGDVLGKSGSANGVEHLHIGVGPSRSFNPKKLLWWGS